ncbi:MAG: translation initiation factor IF-3 [Candidatus Krumholzibacteria bacterium]|nr:translation initiation factor IF-3 [Candidatus Krumholzibacteria bacterium]
MIRVPEVRVINSDGEQLGVMPTDKAREIADEQGLDLVEVSPTAAPPVCRITDYGKFKYEKAKRNRQSKKKQHTIQVKEIKLRPKTEEHDYQFKKRHAEEFLEKGHKLKVTLMFRGREMDHKELGARMLKRLENDLEVLGFVERPAKFEGRFMVMYMSPHSSRTKPPSKKKPEKKAKTSAAGGETDAKAKTSAAGGETDAKADVETDSKPTEKEGQDAETKD